MCFSCIVSIVLQVIQLLICFQFGAWLASAGIFTCSWGTSGLYSEQYTRWALCGLAGAWLLTHIASIGAAMGASPQKRWSEMVISYVQSIVITDYEAVARHAQSTKQLAKFLKSMSGEWVDNALSQEEEEQADPSEFTE